MKQRWIFLMINGSIHKEDGHCKPLDTLTIKKQRYIKQKSEDIKWKIKNIESYWDIVIFQ